MADPATACHVVAVPYPGRGHVNPMMNLCKHLCSKKPDILVTFVVTEEWLGFIGSDKKPANIRYATLPNVIPSELGRSKDFPGFLKAVFENLQAPFEDVLDRLQLQLPVSVIIADTYLPWAVLVGNRRNIPVASLFTMSAYVFAVFYHFDLLQLNNHFPLKLSERGEEVIDYIPGIPSTRAADLPTIFHGTGRETVHRAVECAALVPKVQYLLFTSFHELEFRVIDALQRKFSLPLYAIGPSIPYFQLEDEGSLTQSEPNYLEWLDRQPKGSVLYVSLGSFLSVSSAQMDEIVAGVHSSGVRCLWVARGDASLRFNDGCLDSDKSLVVPWCDQLRVLCEPSVGGFWTHCGWNSTLEAVYAGVPMLAFPIFWDQVPNSKQIAEDWKIGVRVRREVGGEKLITRSKIAEIVSKFMDLEDEDMNKMRGRARELGESCHRAISKGGSSDKNLDSFIRDISQTNSQ